MAKVTKHFEFITALQTGKADFKSVRVSGQYYPTQCDTDGLSYDIEEIWDGYQSVETGWNGMHNLMTAFNVCKHFNDYFYQSIVKATESHVSHLIGIKEPCDVLSIYALMGEEQGVSEIDLFGSATELNPQNR